MPGPAHGTRHRKQFYQYGYMQTTPSATASSPHYDLAARVRRVRSSLQGQDLLLRRIQPFAGPEHQLCQPGLHLLGRARCRSCGCHARPVCLQHNSDELGRKTDLQPHPKLQFEAASFGDPSRHNSVPNTLSTANIPSSLSSYQWGSRDSLVRLNYRITPTWVQMRRTPTTTITSSRPRCCEQLSRSPTSR